MARWPLTRRSQRAFCRLRHIPQGFVGHRVVFDYPLPFSCPSVAPGTTRSGSVYALLAQGSLAFVFDVP